MYDVMELDYMLLEPFNKMLSWTNAGREDEQAGGEPRDGVSAEDGCSCTVQDECTERW